jgi:hypothetical protein
MKFLFKKNLKNLCTILKAITALHSHKIYFFSGYLKTVFRQFFLGKKFLKFLFLMCKKIFDKMQQYIIFIANAITFKKNLNYYEL